MRSISIPLGIRSIFAGSTQRRKTFRHASDVKDFQDSAEVSRAYYPQVEALVQRLTGAERAVVYHHQLRTEDSSSFIQAYARYVHCDFTPARARDMSHNLMVERGLCSRAEAEHYEYARPLALSGEPVPAPR